MVQLCLIPVPSSLGLWPSGVQDLGDTLLAHGLSERLSAPVMRRLEPGPYLREKDPTTGYLNGPAIRDLSLSVAEAVAAARAAGRVPVILGGDCSVALGGLISLRRAGRPGLFWLDGHADFYDGAGDHSGEVADMGLAIATGRNHPLLSGIDGLSPYVRPEDAVAWAFRDEDEAARDGAPTIRGSGIHLFDLPRLRAEGTRGCMALALDRLTRPGIDAVWVHFDTDVIDGGLNPAVDYPLPLGLSWQEAADTLSFLRRGCTLGGVTVSIFNPRKDPDGRIAMALADCLVSGLRG